MFPMLYLSEADVRALLPMPVAVGLMRGVFTRLRSGSTINQPRRRLILPTGSVLHQMAAADGDYFGTKIYSTNRRFGAHFLFLLYRAADGQPLAILEANALGQIRTGAASGYATGLLAAPGPATIAVIGSGFQARSQLEAALTVRTATEVQVWSPSAEKRASFAAELWAAPVRAADSAEAAVRGASIVITATNSKDPVIDDAWIAPGTLINAMGSNQADRRELPSALIHRSRIVVDSVEQARIESGDLLLALDSSGWENVQELKDVDAAHDAAAITVFKSNGLAAEDVAAGGYVYERAIAEGRGRTIPAWESVDPYPATR